MWLSKTCCRKSTAAASLSSARSANRVFVSADVFADGHDRLAGVLQYRRIDADWHEVPLAALGNDSWGASFTVTELGEYEYTVEAWIDRFGSWLAALVAKADAGEDVESDLLEGAAIVEHALRPRRSVRLQPDRRRSPYPRDCRRPAQRPRASRPASRRRAIRSSLRLMHSRPDRSASATADRPLRVTVDPVRARFSAWYEMFPRSCTERPRTPRHAPRRRSAASRRLPPWASTCCTSHRFIRSDPPTGKAQQRAHRGGPAILAARGPSDRAPAAIRRSSRDSARSKTSIASWQPRSISAWTSRSTSRSRRRPIIRGRKRIQHGSSTGRTARSSTPKIRRRNIRTSIRSTSKPTTGARCGTPCATSSCSGSSHGVRIFRVDNPHTKPFAFWEWLIADVRRQHPDAIFLSEAFTRPKVMRRLAKLGFNQSYTYFTWRNTAQELREYLTELTAHRSAGVSCGRTSSPTRPTSCTSTCSTADGPAFEVRLILAATLAASYGIYSGFELCENVAVQPGSEEYSELGKVPDSTARLEPAGQSQRADRAGEPRSGGEHRALQFNSTLTFHDADNPAFLWFSKARPERVDRFDPAGPDWMRACLSSRTRTPDTCSTAASRCRSGSSASGPHQPYVVEDLLDDARYTWQGEWNYVKLDPAERMAHVFVVRPQ